MKGTKLDKGKIDPTILPVDSLLCVAVAMMYGEQKYERNNHEKVNRGLNRFTAAAMRHLLGHIKGLEKGKIAVDKDSGIPHLAMAGANILIALLHAKLDPIQVLKGMKPYGKKR